jgi:uncharacterized protein (TIGR03437 family)
MWALIALTGALAVSSPRSAPEYRPEWLVNAASGKSGPLSPNALATLYGKDLAPSVRALLAADIVNETLPLQFPGIGVRVLVSGLVAHLLYLSPTQINFLIPASLPPGTAQIVVTRDGVAGPAAVVPLAAASPAFFQLNEEYALATRPDGTLIDTANPAKAGELIVLYAAGLGATTPAQTAGRLAVRAASVTESHTFRVLLGGVPLPPENLEYAGITPGYAGLYQINLRLPAVLPPGPEIRLEARGENSPPGLRLPAR